MNSPFYKTIAKSSAHIKSRNSVLQLVCENENLLIELSTIAFDVSDKNHYKAIWIFEMLAEYHIDLIKPYLESICNILFKLKHQSAIRGIARTLLFLHRSNSNSFTEIQEQKIIETCMDWLIGNYMVVPKIVAMHILFDFGKKQLWIHQELKLIIEQDYHLQTAGYKNRAKIILAQLNL